MRRYYNGDVEGKFWFATPAPVHVIALAQALGDAIRRQVAYEAGCLATAWADGAARHG